MGKYLFVSYSRRDAAFVRQLLRFLRGRGFDVWADDQVATGERWDRVVRARIAECAAFILVMSPSADQSDWVAEEIDYARKRRKPIVPLLLDGEVFFGFSRTQHHSVVGGMLPGPELVAQLRGFVGPEPNTPAAAGSVYGSHDHAQFRRKVRQCVDVLRQMLPALEPRLDARLVRARVELDLLDHEGAPAMRNHDLVARLSDPAFGEELAQFNMEFEIAPAAIGSAFLVEAQAELQARLDTARTVAHELDIELVPTGTLATVLPEHATLEHISAAVRYRWLNDLILQERQDDVRIEIAEGEHLRLTLDSIMAEAAGTSLQVFVETGPAEFAAFWNASSAVAAVQIAAGANSPFLLGRRLWAENRIPLLEQVLDSRSPEMAANGVRPRVWFGGGWLGSVLDLFEENSRYFPALLPICDDEDPGAVLAAGGLPSLAELRLHNGTIYRWNRAQYTVDLEANRARIFLENRVLPTGPTVADIVANLAFYLGLISDLGSADEPVWAEMPFAVARDNFIAAGRAGLSADVTWPGLGTIAVTKLITEHLLPAAHAGLTRLGIASADRERYLGIIEGRCATGRNGAVWQTRTVARLEEGGASRPDALRQMVRRYAGLAGTGEPVHTWPVD